MTIRSKLKLAHIAMACLAVLLAASFVVLEKELERDFRVIHEQSGSIHMALMKLRFTGLRAISSANKADCCQTFRMTRLHRERLERAVALNQRR